TVGQLRREYFFDLRFFTIGLSCLQRSSGCFFLFGFSVVCHAECERFHKRDRDHHYDRANNASFAEFSLAADATRSALRLVLARTSGVRNSFVACPTTRACVCVLDTAFAAVIDERV